jgi:Ca2+-binding EF-hand superfamily protein
MCVITQPLYSSKNLSQVHESEIKEMFSVADHDNNGHIGFQEFMVGARQEGKRTSVQDRIGYGQWQTISCQPSK